MPQKPHTILSTLHRGSGVLLAMVSVAAVCDRRRPQGRDAAPSGSQASGAESAVTRHQLPATRNSVSAPLTFPTLSTILHPHEHGQNPLDPRSSQHRTSQGSRHCGMFGVGRQGVSDSGLSSRSSFIAKSYYEENLQRVLDIAERIQAQDSSGDNYPLDRTNVPHSRYGQIVLTPVAAVCDRRRPQGSHAAPSGSNKGAWASRPCRPKASLPIDDLSIGATPSAKSADLPSAATRHQLPATRHSRAAAPLLHCRCHPRFLQHPSERPYHLPCSLRRP